MLVLANPMLVAGLLASEFYPENTYVFSILRLFVKLST